MIKIWAENFSEKGGKNTWKLIYEADLGSPIHCIQWGPWEYGMILAAGTADGKLHLIRKAGDLLEFRFKTYSAHK